MDLRPILPFALLLLGGCMAEQGEFPSLARRPIEAIDPAMEPPAAPAPDRVADAEQARFAAEMEAQASAGEQAFQTALGETRTAIERGVGQAQGSDRWIEAQIALSRLQAARNPVADALRALDERRTASDDPALDAVFAKVSGIDAAQAATVATLAGPLGG